jgi:DNA polymerase III subunit beta
MKFSVEREQFLRPLQLASAVVERRQTLPILGNVLLELTGDLLHITATDLEVEMRVPGTAVIGELDGSITLPARKLLDLCRAAPEGTLLRVEMGGEKAVVRAGRARYTLATLAAADFPRMDRGSDLTPLEASQRDLRRLFQGTQFAMAQQDVRYYLNGLLLEVQGTRLRAVATDGHRMAVGALRLPAGAGESLKVIVPRKSVIEMLRVLGDDQESAQLRIGRDQVVLACNGIEFRSKVIDGSFPDYERVIPRGYEKHADADRGLFAAALLRTAILSNEKLRAVRLEFEAGRLRLHANNAESEEAEEEIEVQYIGDPLEMGFNVGYLLDAAGATSGQRVRLEFADAASSILMHDPEDGAFQYVIMPMRL